MNQPSQAARRDAIIARDGAACVWCSQPFSPQNRPTTEHLIARAKGGPSWPENEVAACRRCNRERGHASPVQWLDELRARGRDPKDDLIRQALLRLSARIANDGGAWRIRRTLAAELRKLGITPPFRS
jgi:5-methylcytosine-specific restriction endonuclease McrA